MSAPLAEDGTPLTTTAWCIYDARAFTVGKSETEHYLSHFPHGGTVRGLCGVVAPAADYETPRNAQWASGYEGRRVCPTCKERS